MSQEVISRNADLKKLRDEGYELEIKGGYAVVHHVPYVDSNRQVQYGTLVSELTMAGDQTVTPNTHVIFFCGEHPCNWDGSPFEGIRHQSSNQTLGDGVTVNHSFSNKPPNGYSNYYEKFTRYISLISAHARVHDPEATAQTFKLISSDADHVFSYLDTHSSRNNLGHLNLKLTSQKVGIVGVGGTGSYVLDLIAKTPVKEIHLFDGDDFLQHNAFRSPGAASKDQLGCKIKKVDYFTNIYSQMRTCVFPHPERITESNIEAILSMDFVFICVDDGPTKALLIHRLITSGISCIDVGMGIHCVDEALVGIIRTTAFAKSKHDHLGRVSFASSGDNAYNTNIQTADLNCLNAALAVIKWKKLYGFYHDVSKEHHTTYTVNTGVIDNAEYIV